EAFGVLGELVGVGVAGGEVDGGGDVDVFVPQLHERDGRRVGGGDGRAWVLGDGAPGGVEVAAGGDEQVCGLGARGEHPDVGLGLGVIDDGAQRAPAEELGAD